MAVIDSHGNPPSESSVKAEENPQTLSSPEPGATAKVKRKRKKRNEGSNEQFQAEVCPKPLVDSPFSQEGNAEAAADNACPNPKKKKKKIKNVHGEEQLQASDPPIAGCVESDDTKGEGARQGDPNGNGDLHPKPLLDTPVPIVSREEKSEGTALNPNATKKKKRKKKILQDAEDTRDPSIRIGVKSDVTKDEGSREGYVNDSGALYPKPLIDTAVPIVSHEENSEATVLNPGETLKKKRKKKILQVAEDTCDPSIRIGVKPDVTKDEGSREGDVNDNGGLYPKPLVDTPVPIVSHEENSEATVLNPGETLKKKRKKKVLQVAEDTCDPSIRIGVKPDVTKDEGSREGDANDNGGFYPKPLVDTPVPIVSHEENSEATVLNPGETLKKKRKKKILQVAEDTCDPSIRIGVKPDVTKDEGSREGDVDDNGGLYPKPLVDTPVPIVSHEENSEATVLNPGETLKKKRKEKILQGAGEICDHSIRKGVEPDVTKDEGSREGDVNGNEGLSPEPLLDTKIPVVSHEENAEGTARNPSPTPKRKKRKKKILQGADEKCEASIRIGVEPDVKKDERSQEGDVNKNEGLCPKPLLDTQIPIVSHEGKAEGTAQSPSPAPQKKKRKKKILQGGDQICDPSIQIGLEPDVAKDEGSREGDVNENAGFFPEPLLDSKIPLVSKEENAEGTARKPSPTPKKKRKKKILQGAEEKCEPSILIGVEADVKKDEGSREGDVNENEGLCPTPLLDTPIPIVFHEEKAEKTPQSPIPTSKKKGKKNILQGADQVCEPSIQIGLEPDVAKDEGSREAGVNENGGLCPDPLLDTKSPIVSHEKNAEGTARNPSATSKRKRKKKILQGPVEKCEASIQIGVEPDVKKDEGSREGDGNENEGFCPTPLLDTPIPIVSHEENAEGTAQSRSPTLKKKKKKKILQGADQICDPSIQIGLQPDVAKDEGSQEGDVNENGGLCPEPLLDTKIPIISHDENAEGTARNPSPTPKRKRKKKILQGAGEKCEASIRIGVEPDVKKDEGSLEGDVNENEGLCPKPLLDTPIPIISHEEKAEGTAQSPSPTLKKKRKKKGLQGADQICDFSPNPKKGNLHGAQQICDPSIRIGLESDEPNEEGGHQCSDRAERSTQNPNPTPKRKKRKNVQGQQQQLQICDPSISIGVESDVMKEGAKQVDANEVGVSGISEESPLPDSTAPEDTHRKKDSVRKKKKALKSQGAEAESEPEPKESNSTENPQQCTLDLKPKSKVKKGPGANAENSGVCSKPEVAPQLYIAATTALEVKEKAELIEVNIEHSEAGSKPELEPSIDIPSQMEARKKKRMKKEKKKETKPSESHAQHPQPEPCSNHAPAVRGIIEECPGPEGAESSGKPPETAVALSIDPKIPDQASPNDTATPIDQDQKVSEKKRKSNPVSAPSTEPTIQTGQDPPVDPATPVDPEQMTTKKSKESNSALKNDGLKYEKRNADLRKSNPVAAPSIEPTIQTGQDSPIDPATPVDPEQMKKKGKESNSALKNDGLESVKRNADLTAVTSVQKIEGPTAKKSMVCRRIHIVSSLVVLYVAEIS